MAEELESIVAELADTFGESTGAIKQAGASHDFTGAVVTSRRRAPGPNSVDVERITMILPASGVAIQPLRDSALAFTGDASLWAISEADPVQAGATVAAWRLTLTTWTGRDEAQA